MVNKSRLCQLQQGFNVVPRDLNMWGRLHVSAHKGHLQVDIRFKEYKYQCRQVNSVNVGVALHQLYSKILIPVNGIGLTSYEFHMISIGGCHSVA
jgi:hypothetical protein